MPKIAKELTAIEVKRLAAGVHPVGGVSGLYLQVSDTGGRSWLLRTPIGGKRREIGLGSYPGVSLKDARRAAAETKQQIKAGIDPIEEKKKRRLELSVRARRAITFKDAFDGFVPVKQKELSEGTYRKNWRNSVDEYAMAYLGSKTVQDITVDDVFCVLQPIWNEKRATADKLRRKLGDSFDYFAALGVRDGENPAEWSGKLSKLLPKPADGSDEEHYPAVQLLDMQRCWAGIQARQGASRYALSFQILTATRTGAIRYMTWEELDFKNRVWTVQPRRKSSKISKKMGARRVPLTSKMVELLEELPRFPGSPYVFVAPRGGALSDGAIGSMLRDVHDTDIRNGGRGFFDVQTGEKAVPHGFRSTFKDWATEQTSYDWNLSEAALWHLLGSKVEQAYARSDLIEKRRAMMDDWGKFVSDE